MSDPEASDNTSAEGSGSTTGATTPTQQAATLLSLQQIQSSLLSQTADVRIQTLRIRAQHIRLLTSLALYRTRNAKLEQILAQMHSLHALSQEIHERVKAVTLLRNQDYEWMGNMEYFEEKEKIRRQEGMVRKKVGRYKRMKDGIEALKREAEELGHRTED